MALKAPHVIAQSPSRFPYSDRYISDTHGAPAEISAPEDAIFTDATQGVDRRLMLLALSCNLVVLECICLLYRFEAEGKTANSHQIIEALSLQLYQERTCKFAEVRSMHADFWSDSHPRGTHMRQGSLHGVFAFSGI